MRRRNLMRSRVYRSDSNGKSISSTFNQKNQITPAEYINTDMSFKSSKNPQQRVIKTNNNIIFSLDISCCKLYNVMNDIPIDTNIGTYGILQDLFIEKIYYKNLSGVKKDCLNGLSNIEILTYTKCVTLHFIVLSNNITPTHITINGWNLKYIENQFQNFKQNLKKSIF